MTKPGVSFKLKMCRLEKDVANSTFSTLMFLEEEVPSLKNEIAICFAVVESMGAADDVKKKLIDKKNKKNRFIGKKRLFIRLIYNVLKCLLR